MTDLGIGPAALRAQLAGQTPPTVIDVRDGDEYAAGHLPGALHIPGDELANRLAEIPATGRSSPTETCATAATPAASGPRRCSGRAATRRGRWTAASRPGRRQAIRSSTAANERHP